MGLNEISVFQFKPYPGTKEFNYLQRSKPEIIDRLSYLHRTGQSTTNNDTVAYKTERKDVWLADDIKITQVSSGVVREYVVRSLELFYE